MMLVGLARSEIEVVEPLPIEFSQATPTIVSPSEAMQWLNAHHVHSPITRHALVVLESIDAVDLAFDTFVCALLDGEVDTSGYPEYNAIVGGVAAHWDEATGDMICRAVVGWGGKGVRGDTDRIGAKLLAGILSNILASQYALGLTPSSDRCRPPAGAAWSARTAGSRRRTSGPSTARSAACASCAAEDRSRRCPSTTTTAPRAGGGSRSSTASTPSRRRPVRCAARDRSARRSPRRLSTTRARAGPRRSARGDRLGQAASQRHRPTGRIERRVVRRSIVRATGRRAEGVDRAAEGPKGPVRRRPGRRSRPKPATATTTD